MPESRELLDDLSQPPPSVRLVLNILCLDPSTNWPSSINLFGWVAFFMLKFRPGALAAAFFMLLPIVACFYCSSLSLFTGDNGFFLFGVNWPRIFMGDKEWSVSLYSSFNLALGWLTSAPKSSLNFVSLASLGIWIASDDFMTWTFFLSRLIFEILELRPFSSSNLDEPDGSC